MNVKLDQEQLDAIKRRGHELGRPYHALARELIENALAAEERALGLRPIGSQPPLGELMVFLLHARNSRGQEAVRGITRMQKLLYVLEQNLAPQAARFHAHNFGPFSEGVGDAAEALRLAGFLKSSPRPAKGPPTYAQMKAAAERRGTRPKTLEEFALSEEGHEAAERLRRSDSDHQRLYDAVAQLRREWDDDELIERVYERWPESTERSVIRDEVAARRRARRKR
jgi:hypothetical protein